MNPTETADPLPRTKHRVTIEFEIDVAPELADKVKNSIGRNIHTMFGYPTYALAQNVFSFNAPEPPKEINVTVTPNE